VPELALALVIFAAALHAGWNLVLKQVDEKYIVTWWSVILCGVLALPVAMSAGLPSAQPAIPDPNADRGFYMAALASLIN
jgi:hypothetical protein